MSCTDQVQSSSIRPLLWSIAGFLSLVSVGLGGAAAFAGVLHLLGHSLLKSAVFFGVGQAAQLKGSQKIADIGGLVASHPGLGWALVVAIAAVAGLPPFALFASEFLLISQAAARLWWLALPLGLGVFIAVAAKISAMQALCLGTPTPDAAPAERGAMFCTLAPMAVHLALTLLLGMALPTQGAALLSRAAELVR